MFFGNSQGIQVDGFHPEVMVELEASRFKNQAALWQIPKSSSSTEKPNMEADIRNRLDTSPK